MSNSESSESSDSISSESSDSISCNSEQSSSTRIWKYRKSTYQKNGIKKYILECNGKYKGYVVEKKTCCRQGVMKVYFTDEKLPIRKVKFSNTKAKNELKDACLFLEDYEKHQKRRGELKLSFQQTYKSDSESEREDESNSESGSDGW